MKMIDKIILRIKSIFCNKKEVLDKSKDIETNKTENNINNIIVKKDSNTYTDEMRNKIETLVCEGDGLGIQPKMTY